MVPPPSPEMKLFTKMLGEQVSQEDLSAWAKMKIPEAAAALSRSTTQSHFLQLRFREELIAVARGDSKLKEENRRLETSVKIKEEEIQRLVEANKKLKTCEAAARRDRDTLSSQVSILDIEKDQLVATHDAKVKELQL